MKYEFDKEKVLAPEQIIHVNTEVKATELSKYLKSIKQLLANGDEYNVNEVNWKYGTDTGYIPSTGQVGNVTLAKKYKVIPFEFVLIGLNSKGIRQILSPKLMTSLKREVEPINEKHPGKICSGNMYDNTMLTEDNSIDMVPDCLKNLKISSQEDCLFALAVEETLGFKPKLFVSVDNPELIDNTKAFRSLLSQVSRPINEKDYSKYGLFDYGVIKLHKYAAILTETDAIPYKECVVLTHAYSDYAITECYDGITVLRNGNHYGLINVKTKECSSYESVIRYLTVEKTTYSLKTTYERQIKRLNDEVKDYSSSLLQKVRSLSELQIKADNTPNLSEDMILDGEWIKWYTPFISFYAPSNPYGIDKVPLGRFEIKFRLTDNNIYFKNLDKTTNGYQNNMQAPHVFSDTTACLGTFTPAIVQAIGSSNIELLKQVVLQFLTNVNEEDPAGKRWAAWLEDKTNVCSCGYYLKEEHHSKCPACRGNHSDDDESDDDYRTCDICGSESAEYSDEYNGDICDDCFNERFCKCEICDQNWIPVNDSICDHCRETHMWCERCDTWTHQDDYYSDKDCCNECHDTNYRTCPKCDQEVSIDDYDMDNDLCNECSQEVHADQDGEPVEEVPPVPVAVDEPANTTQGDPTSW